MSKEIPFIYRGDTIRKGTMKVVGCPYYGYYIEVLHDNGTPVPEEYLYHHPTISAVMRSIDNWFVKLRPTGGDA